MDSLIGHREFDGNANDSSGNSLHGTEFGGYSYSSGLFGDALSLDGSSGYASVPNTGQFSLRMAPTADERAALERAGG